MGTKKYHLNVLLCVFFALTFISCGDDEIKPRTPDSTNTGVSKPEVKVTSRKANTTYDGWWVIGTVTTGGDKPSNVNCYLEWSAFSTKQSGTVNLSNRDKMNVTNSSSNRVQFKKEHAGIKGKYIYFRLVGSNSKYSSTTSIDYMVATSN